MNDQINLELNPETVRYIINMAREFQVQEGATSIEDPISPSDDWAMQALADQEGDPTQDELKIAIQDLEPDQQVQLVALMWLGRGSFSVVVAPPRKRTCALISSLLIRVTSSIIRPTIRFRSLWGAMGDPHLLVTNAYVRCNKISITVNSTVSPSRVINYAYFGIS